MQVYLDSAATTKPYQEVVDVMVDLMQNHWRNPSSSYADDERQIVENVRAQIAKDINADPSEIIFTGGACESNALAYAVQGIPSYISSKLEHKSIENMQREFCFDLIGNNRYGFVDLDELDNTLDDLSWFTNDFYRLVSIQAANGEIGTIQDIKTISDIAHEYDGGIFHTDATQLFPEQRIDVKELGIDLMSISAQKFHGPRGAGILYVKNGIELCPLIYGSQENGLRGGTYNTAAIAGMGKALELTRLNNASERVERLRDRLLRQLLQVGQVFLNGPAIGSQRLKNNISLTIDGVNAEKLVTLCALQGIYISKGSACNSYNPEPSATLKAIGLSDEQAFNTIRITLDEFNTEAEIDYASDIIIKLIERIRSDHE